MKRLKLVAGFLSIIFLFISCDQNKRQQRDLASIYSQTLKARSMPDQGKLIITHGDRFDGRAPVEIYQLESADGKIYQLEGLSKNTKYQFKHGDQVQIQGDLEGNSERIMVKEMDVISKFIPNDPPPPPPEEELKHVKLAVIVFYFQNQDSPHQTVEWVENKMEWTSSGSSGLNVQDYYIDSSMGTLFVDSKVFGEYQIPFDAEGCNKNTWSDVAEQMAVDQDGFDPSEYDKILFTFPEVDCNYWGIFSGQHRIFTTAPNNQFVPVTVHELGHSFGIGHAGRINCHNIKGARIHVQTQATDTCDSTVYRDPLDPMGSEFWRLPVRDMKARSKIQSDYMGHRIQTYTNNTQLSTEIIRVYPVEDGLDDVKIVYIPLGHQAVNDFQRLSVEYRKNYALDKVGAYGQSGPAPAGIYLYNRYHKMIDYTLDTDDFWDGAMRAGDSLDLMSSYGVKIEVLSETSEFAEIKVTRNGIGICQKSNPSVVYSQNGVYSKSATPGETVEFASGGLDSYLKIRNNDIGPCEPRTLRRSNQSTPLNWDVYTIAGEPELDPLPFSVGSWNFNVKPGQEKVYFNYVNQGLLMDVPQDACNRTYTTRLYIEQLDFPFQFNTSFKVNVFDGEECDDEKK